MWIDKRDDEIIESNQTKDAQAESGEQQVEASESSSENDTLEQQVVEEKILSKTTKIKDSVDDVLSKLEEWDEKIVKNQAGFVAWFTALSNDISHLIEEWWSDDYIDSMQRSKEYIDAKVEKMREWLSAEEEKEVEEIVGTWASNDYEFSDISNQDFNNSDNDSNVSREFSL